jgi:hypothetical protein
MMGELSRLPSALSKIYINLVEFYGKDLSPQLRISSQSFHLASSLLFALLLPTLARRKLPMRSPAFSF